MSELIIYQSDDGKARVQFRAMDGSLWLSQLQLAELYGVTVANINIHLRKIVQEGELAAEAVIKQDLIPAADGKRYPTKLYRLDMVLAVGYRVRSVHGTQFRQWATAHLTEYLVKGFVMDDERLKNPGGWDYFDELLARIREIRASEKRFYQKVRDTCAVAQFPYQLIEYEINEAALLRLRTARVDVEAFVQQGLSLTVDGFGLSPHSHDLLQDLSIQKIKFAPQLVKNVAHDAEMLAYLQSFAQLANEREVQMMVDGLHSESQAIVMQRLGCVLGQGPHFSQALSAQQFEAFLRDQIRDMNAKQKTIQQNVSAAALSF